ncbi:MAG: hypothetical protein Q7V58_03460 [Actinomycetota bacterium]|nr:hypothetical protein [Actinomycetota bacterium]
MSEPTDDTTPIGSALPEPLPLADQQPVVATRVAPAAPAASHTRTILEVVGGVVAAGLIVVAGIGGFVIGNLTADSSDGPRGERLVLGGERSQGGPQFGDGQGPPGFPGQQGQGQGPGQGPGQRGGPGHGHDRGQQPGFPGMQPTVPTPPDQGLTPPVPSTPATPSAPASPSTTG